MSLTGFLGSLFFLCACGVDLWAVSIALVGARVGPRVRMAYLAVAFVAAVSAVWITTSFSYFSNPNTRIIGWPVPRVIFQRDTPSSDWLDYIGPTMVLAYPMNFILYMLVPSLVLIVISRGRTQTGSTAA